MRVITDLKVSDALATKPDTEAPKPRRKIQIRQRLRKIDIVFDRKKLFNDNQNVTAEYDNFHA